MKQLFLFIALLISCISCSKTDKLSVASKGTGNQSSIVATASHVFIIYEENHSLEQIKGNPEAPHMNALIDSGYSFNNFHAVDHPSQPNYIAFFSGSQNGITTDACLKKKFANSIHNIANTLLKAGKTFASYSEDLPITGSTICTSGDYVRKHNPSSDFLNVPDSLNKTLNQLPTDYSQLENLVMIIPNLQHDMHNGSIAQADSWLQSVCGNLIAWAKTNNSIVILMWDENETSSDTTNNRIPCVMYGQHIITGGSDSIYHNTYNMTSTVCQLLSVGRKWTDSLINNPPITGFSN